MVSCAFFLAVYELLTLLLAATLPYNFFFARGVHVADCSPPPRPPPPLAPCSALQSFIAVFVLLTEDGYAEWMHQTMYLTNPAAALYFVIVVVLGNFVVLNLFLAILILSMSEITEADAAASEPPSRM